MANTNNFGLLANLVDRFAASQQANADNYTMIGETLRQWDPSAAMSGRPGGLRGGAPMQTATMPRSSRRAGRTSARSHRGTTAATSTR